MIVAMKKVSVIVQAKDREAAIKNLRALGVVHVEHQRPPQGEDIRRLEEDRALVDAALDVFSRSHDHGLADKFEQKPLRDWQLASRHIVDLDKRLDQLKEYGTSLQHKITEWQRWGDFDPAIIEQLAGKGIVVRLYQIPRSQIKDVPDDVIVRTVFQSAGMAHCAVIVRSRTDLPFKEIALPKMGLSAMKERIAHDEHTAQGIRQEIVMHLCHRQSLIQIKGALEKKLEFSRAVQGMGEEGALSYLVGYAPHDTEKLLLESAHKYHWAIAVTEPSDEDAVPTLIRNPRWVSIIQPVFKFIDIIPGYRELDISLVFLAFFSVFFGMLIGDAGIGGVFLILTAFAQIKFGKKVKQVSLFVLFYLLSICAIAWGVLSGTFFGQEWLSPHVKPLLPQLRDDAHVQSLCFFIGALHLSIAHAWRAIVKAPSVQAWAEIGWISILWAAFFLAKVLVLGQQLDPSAKPLFIIGSLLVIFFSSPRKNIAKGIGEGLGSYLLSVVNSFTDVVSYIRLFAVGLATVAVADAFNAMALGIGFSNIGTTIATAAILVVGHGLNVLLGPMSVLVHGVRLNVLEFCNHIDIKWSGFAYNPLRH